LRRVISGGYVLAEHGHVRFQVGAYDPAQPLVIDPRLHYSTYLGGGGGLDSGVDVALDPDGNILVTGETRSLLFPLENPVRDKLLGTQDAFVTKFNPTLSAVLYSTYLGGGGREEGNSLAVDSEGNAYVTGETTSSDFPIANPIQASFVDVGMSSSPS
jgi:hypothetical protein